MQQQPNHLQDCLCCCALTSYNVCGRKVYSASFPAFHQARKANKHRTNI